MKIRSTSELRRRTNKKIIVHFEIISSKVYKEKNMEFQIHLCNDIYTETMIENTLSQIKANSTHQCFPYAYLLKHNNSFIENYNDSECIGFGWKIMRILKKRFLFNTMICVSLNKKVISNNVFSNQLHMIAMIYVFYVLIYRIS